MEEITFTPGSVPVVVVARVYGKDASWVRAGIISGWLPIGKATRIDTILNRVDSEHFPDTVYEVIYQPNQFSSMWNGRVDRCEVREDICGLVYEELESRTNYEVMFFTAGEYSAYDLLS